MRRRASAFGSVLAALFITAPPAHADGPRDAPVRVLFVGNSFTRMNDLPRMVRRLAEHDLGLGSVETVRVTEPGATLRRLWIGRDARRRIAWGRFTHVVLQEHSMRPIERPDEATAFARRFDDAIDRTGARTVLYATWARRRHLGRVRDELRTTEAAQARIDDAYASLARELGADVAPVGRAWLAASRDAPDVALYRRDGMHPSPEGSYLAACVLYGVLTGRSPETIDWAPWPMRRRVAAELRRIATAELLRRRDP